MNNFKGGKSVGGGFRGGNSGGKPSFQKKSWGNDRGGNRDSGRETALHKATCSHCGKSCEVPFRPTGDKPVYCRDCFNRDRDRAPLDARGAKPESYRHEGKRSYNNDRPAPRAECARPEATSAGINDEAKKQLSEISYKLDRLINAMEKMTQTNKESKEESVALRASMSTPVISKAFAKVSPKKTEAAKTLVVKKRVATKVKK